MNEEIRAEALKLIEITLTCAVLYWDDDPARDPAKEPRLVATVFEALGDRLRWEDYGNPLARKWPQRVSVETMEAVLANYLEGLRNSPQFRHVNFDDVEGDDNAAMMAGVLDYKDKIESAVMVIMTTVMDRGIAPVELTGFSDLLDELRAWDAYIAEYLSPEVVLAFWAHRPPGPTPMPKDPTGSQPSPAE